MFVEGETKTLEIEMNEQMNKCIKHFDHELTSIRTGRASVDMLEGIRAECYEQQMLLRDLATLAAPDARLLTIQPWDKGTLGAIEKAILTSDLGLTPLNDGEIIRLQLPQMSSERRDELVKILHKRVEECRVQIRNVRRDFMNAVRDAQKKNNISEDFAKRLEGLIQKITDTFISLANERADKKERGIRDF
jgi:ribosome recycling factor